jgi:NAD(P)-dependent dehydrogenase (short-subunit alcohol dehydrogenase family)
MDLGLRGRNAVVLGETRGIGRAIVETLGGEGAGAGTANMECEGSTMEAQMILHTDLWSLSC